MDGTTRPLPHRCLSKPLLVAGPYLHLDKLINHQGDFFKGWEGAREIYPCQGRWRGDSFPAANVNPNHSLLMGISSRLAAPATLKVYTWAS